MSSWRSAGSRISVALLAILLAGVSVAFPVDALDVTVELYYDSTWNDHTTDTLDRDDTNSIVIERGRRSSEGSRCDPGHAILKFNNANGKYSPRNPNSELYGKIGRNTPIRISYEYDSVTYVRFVGEVTAWPSRWDPSETDVWVQVDAWGILRRLGQGASPLRSALRRAVLSTSPAPIAYWPLEDGVRASTARSGLVGGNPITGSIIFQAADGPDGSDGAVSIRQGGQAWGTVTGANATFWAVDHVALWPDTDTAAANSMSIQINTTGGTVSSFRISANDSPDVVQLSYVVPPSTTYTALSTTEPGFNGEWKYIVFEAFQNGANINVGVIINNTLVLNTSIAGQTMGAITRVGLATFEDVPDNEVPNVGHIIVWDYTPATDFPQAAEGYDGELVTDRLARLCDEEGIPISITGESLAQMGPQRVATLLELLDDCAGVDRGFLHEQRDAVGLAYRTNSSRFNQ